MGKDIILIGIFLSIGIIFFIGGIMMLAKLKYKLRHYIKTKGIITNKEKKIYDISVGEIADVYFEYEVRYEVNGKTIQKISNFKTQKELNLGNVINVYYNANKVCEFLIFPKQEILFYKIFILIGGMMLFMSIFLLLK